ncbi:hypothetical protein [Alkanindiges illinoisensis]|uniref:hypothetical protein n=1 Tax=Alkanindiges illinoisensis TaxID=197183 RepID=UPI00047D988A|nr:hypothetical protein [Alkanindiges illinoisensis]
MNTIESIISMIESEAKEAIRTTGENYIPPFKTKDEGLQALEKAKLSIGPPLEWPADWPTDAHFYRININTPIFYKYQHGQIKRWVKYAKCWVDSCIPDWAAFCEQNGVKSLIKWPSIAEMLSVRGLRNDADYMTLIHGEWPACDAKEKDESIKHGTETAYRYGCRCEICINAHNQQTINFQKKARNHFAETGEFLSTKTKHGTYSSYVNYGCRCELCTEANRKQNKKTLNKIRTGYSKTGRFPKADQHGTKYGYSIGCRCEACSKAYADYQKKRRATKKNG